MAIDPIDTKLIDTLLTGYKKAGRHHWQERASQATPVPKQCQTSAGNSPAFMSTKSVSLEPLRDLQFPTNKANCGHLTGSFRSLSPF
ncbi:MAG: hypothetical protein WAN65_13235 [Candidatus Sulfotelmatobacter sp.]